MSPVVEFVRAQGGFCTRGEALAATSRRDVDGALESGEIVWISRGRYGLPDLDEAIATAHGLRAVLSHTSAALWHGWEVKVVPTKAHVTVPRRRRVQSGPLVRVHRADLELSEIEAGISTSVRRTLVDCTRSLPADEALAIADSALRHGVDPSVLAEIERTVRGPGRTRVLRAVRAADARAANPFESCARSIALDVPGLHVRPQTTIVGSRQTVRVDLVDERLKIAIEADSFEWHGGRADLRRDARRYNFLVVDGWLVLRFAYEDVMFHPEYVRDVLVMAVHARTQIPVCSRCAA